MKRTIAFIVSALAIIPIAYAGVFPDVPADSPYFAAIEYLYERGVIKGNPDGTYAPLRRLNRAELLTIVYRAAEKETRAIYGGCFPDVPTTAWYSDVVCTGKHNGDIQGYPNGKFHAENEVNTVETIKIVLNTLGFAIPTLTLENQVGLDFKNVNIKSWYAPYLLAALLHGLIPQELISDNDFRADGAMNRAIAAEIVYRALRVPVDERKRVPEINQKKVELPSGTLLVDFPFDRKGRTAERGAAAFVFDSKEEISALFTATNESSAEDGIECYLYLLGDTGLPMEIYEGYQEGTSCYLRAALRVGRYQFESRALAASTIFAASGKKSPGDGNDGYREAAELTVSSAREGSLSGDGPDYHDWYSFSLRKKEVRTVTFTSELPLVCYIIPGPSVELSSFDSPKCNEEFEYEPGKYYISIRRAPPAMQKQNYTIELH